MRSPKLLSAAAVLLAVSGLAVLPGAPRTAPQPHDGDPTPDTLAQSALGTVLADLAREIAAGSFTLAAGPATVYRPKAPATAVPALAGSTGTGGLENLLKRSANGIPFFTGTNYDTATYPAGSRAANVSSAASSANGLAVLPARWNRPLLLLKSNVATDTDQTPVGTGANAFVPPDWVLVARDGSNPTAWSAGLRASASDPTSVVGRYAYTVYDEGGLLDMTVAGHLGSADARQVGYKDSLAAADLTRVSLTQAQIDAVVNWRGSHTFAGRQDLITLLTQGVATDASTRAGLQGSLRYLGTFSRGLGQPSYAPASRVSGADNPNPRPLIQTSTNGGNNVGDNYTSGAAQDTLSPNFLTVRAATAFTRNDGSVATAGEPLVKSRFALQRLAWLTYKGPSASRNLTDADMAALVAGGVPVALLQQGTASSIQRYFGLVWDAAASRWRYTGHNRPSGASGDAAAGAIHRLDEVAALGTREPDFFELLKATVDPASLAKASTNGPTADPSGVLAPLNTQYIRDISVDAALLQLGANIIDQFDCDGFPTRVVFDDGSGRPPREFRGIENLPYLYRIHPGVLKAREAIPTSVGVDTKSAELHSGTASGYTSNPLLDTGVGVLLAVPDLWNPHDQNSSLGNPRPGVNAASVRVIANSAAPDYLGTGTSNTFTVGSFVHADNAGNYSGNSYNTPGSYGAPVIPTSVTPNAPGFSRTPTPSGGFGTAMSGTNYGYSNPQIIDSASTSSTLAFNVPDATIFREPTLLVTPNVAGSGLSMVTSNPDLTGLQDSNAASVYKSSAGGYGLTSVNANPFSTSGGVASQTTPPLYTGIYLGAYPLRWVGTRWTNSDRNSTGWVYTSRYMGILSSPVDGVTYSLQYRDEAGNWVTYDEKYVNTYVFWLNPLGALIQPGALNYAFVDPRTARFGSPGEIYSIYDKYHYRAPAVSANWLDAANDVSVTERPDYHAGFGSNFRGNYQSQPDWGAYTSPGWHYRNVGTAAGVNAVFFQSGLFAQNNPYLGSDGIRYDGDAGVGAQDPTFYSDADGVVRRAMGGHVSVGSTSTVGQPLATASTVSGGRATATAQSASRPKVLNRPFRSVAELGYVFSGMPWRNLDFSTAESGGACLLDVFCVSDNDASAPAAGRLNLNTRQSPTLQAVLSGTYTSESSGAFASLSTTDAAAVANLLVTRTSQGPAAGPNANAGPQPLANVGDLVGRWNSRQAITYASYTPALNINHNIDGSLSYDGFSTDLDTLPAANALSSPISAQRESAVRALSNVGNTRVWNLLIDVVAQTGGYSQAATGLDQFTVDGSQRYWLHVAIDRLTGAVLDQSLEAVPETAPSDLTLTGTTVPENQPAGTTVGTLGTVDDNAANVFTYALVRGAGGDDNASFTVSGNALQTGTALRYLDKSSYHVRVRAVDQDGMSYEKALTINVTPGAYTSWKITNFGGSANDPAVAGDLADADGDGLANLVEYALGTPPLSAGASGIEVRRVGDTLQFNYTRSSTATDVTAHVYRNGDLTNPDGWTTSGVSETMLSDDGTLQHWQATVPSVPDQRAFLRLQVSAP